MPQGAAPGPGCSRLNSLNTSVDPGSYRYARVELWKMRDHRVCMDQSCREHGAPVIGGPASYRWRPKSIAS